MESKQRTKAIESSIQRFRDGKDYHRQFLDQYLPIEGLIGDIGCAEGRIGAFYHSEKRRFVAFDTDAEVLAIGQKLYPAIDFRLGSAYNLPLPDQCLDAYIGLGIFELDGMTGEVAAAEAARVTTGGAALHQRTILKPASSISWCPSKLAGYRIAAFFEEADDGAS